MTTTNLLQLAPALKWLLLPLADHAAKPGSRWGNRAREAIGGRSASAGKSHKTLEGRAQLSLDLAWLGLAPFDACHLLSSICWLFHLLRPSSSSRGSRRSSCGRATFGCSSLEMHFGKLSFICLRFACLLCPVRLGVFHEN